MKPALEVINLRFQYSDGKEALRSVSFTVQEGERIGLVGPNGAGKSTLLLHLNGVLPEEPPRQASVFVYGVPVGRETLEDVHRMVGLLFQDPDDQLFCPTVSEDVAFGPAQFGLTDEAMRSAVATALGMVGLAGYENRSPYHLSKGEKQRVCLAGVLACQPKILALDEPTSDLDPRGRRELKKILRTLHATTIIASHDLDLVAELCDRIILLDDGLLVADGAARTVLMDEALMLEHGLERPHFLEHRHPH